MTYANHFAARTTNATAQTQAIPGRESEMVRNNAGGMVFTVGTFDRLRRFLILGSDAPTYYVNERDLTLDNIEGVLAALTEDGLRTVAEIVDVSVRGRAPKNDSALYALALAASYGAQGKTGVHPVGSLAQRLTRAGDPSAAAVRRAAFSALPQVARTGTHLMQFVGFLKTLRGWGRGPKDAIARWLDGFTDEKLADLAVKYRQRAGWTMRDILRLAHPRDIGGDRGVLIDWIAHRALTSEEIAAHEARVVAASETSGAGAAVGRATVRRHPVRAGEAVIADARKRFKAIDGYHLAQQAITSKQIAEIIRSHDISLEAVPTEFLKEAVVWEELLEGMKPNALVRNLNRMTAAGVIAHGSQAARFVVERLTDEDTLRRARVHPFKLLVALKVYQSGHGVLGDLTWTPVREVVDALDAGFYAAFQAVESSNKRFSLGIDVSGSMTSACLTIATRKSKRGIEEIRGPVSARVASAAMALVTMATERDCFVGGFTAGAYVGGRSRGRSMYGGDGFTPLNISPRRRLDDVVRTISNLPFGGTDAALPIAYATEHNQAVDVFVIYTDNETWAGPKHVTEALQRYRDKTGIPAKLVACGMTATSFSVVDPTDPLQMNVVGFDGDTPAFISDFARS